MAMKIDKTELAQKINNLEGLDNETKSQLLELLHERKRYGLVWEDKPEDVEERLRDQLPVLREVKERAILSDDPAAPNHILIEGDNLEALTTLSYTHEGKIDVIYIDPPYNTGKEDEFMYNDKYVDAEDEFRYSKWLSFLKKRLKIAHKLLSDKGVLLVSIDDYSCYQLKLLCDSIFEKSSNPNSWNYIATLIWNKQHSQQQGIFKKYHEYVLVYAKCAANVKNVLSTAEGIIEAGAMKKISRSNPASSFNFPAGIKFEAPDGTRFTGVYGDSEKVEVIDGVLEAKDGLTLYPVTLKAGWTQKNQMLSWIKGEETFDTKGQRVLEFYFNSTGKIKCRKERSVVTPSTILPSFGMGSSHTAHLEEILCARGIFSNPKPVPMIQLFAEWFCKPDGIILDFFAGSGTTLESTMKLNNEDHGNRTCILVQSPDCTWDLDKKGNKVAQKGCLAAFNAGYDNISDITYERNKRVIQGYTTPKGEQVEGLHANTLRYYRTDYVARESSATAKRELMHAATDMLCIKNNIYSEQTQFGNLRLRKNVARFFQDGERGMLVIYHPDAIEPIVEGLKQMDVHTPIIVYVFSLNDYAMDADFEDVAEKVSLCALPAAILNAYRKVLPKKQQPKTKEEKQSNNGELNFEEDRL